MTLCLDFYLIKNYENTIKLITLILIQTLKVMKDSFIYKAKFFLAPVFLFTAHNIFSPYHAKGLLTFVPIYFIFGLIPILDIIFPKSTINPSSKDEEIALSNNILFDILVWSALPIQLFFMFDFLQEFSANYKNQSVLTLLGWITTLGITCIIFGINVGHELGHRSNSWQRFIGKALLWTSLRMSFYIEHNWGHHTNVSTDKDPASAKKNEWVYTFIPKSIFMTWLNSWEIQRKLLKSRKASFFSIYNDVLWYTFIQWGTIIAIALVYDWQTAVGFVLAALFGMVVLECVNYIEHYGLRRTIGENGQPERVLPIHSWNSDHSFSGAGLFNLSRHSDHHYISSRPYQILRNYETVPNMPAGYAGMVVLSLVPPLWFYVMNKRVDAVLSSYNRNQAPTTMESS